jgi:hypothetical protein
MARKKLTANYFKYRIRVAYAVVGVLLSALGA